MENIYGRSTVYGRHHIHSGGYIADDSASASAPAPAPAPGAAAGRSIHAYGLLESDLINLSPATQSFDGDGAFMVAGWFDIPALNTNPTEGGAAELQVFPEFIRSINVNYKWANPNGFIQNTNARISYDYRPITPTSFFSDMEGYNGQITEHPGSDLAPDFATGWHHHAIIIRRSKDPGDDSLVREAYIDGVKIFSDPETGGNYFNGVSYETYNLPPSADQHINRIKWTQYPGSIDFTPEGPTDPEFQTTKAAQLVYVSADSLAFETFDMSTLYNNGVPLSTGDVRTMLGGLPGAVMENVSIYDFSPETTSGEFVDNVINVSNSPAGFIGTGPVAVRDLITTDNGPENGLNPATGLTFEVFTG